MNVDEQKTTARTTGVIYFVFALLAIYGAMYVPSQITVPGDAAATAKNIRAKEFLFRSAIVSNIIGLTLFVFVVLRLYRLLKPVDENQARLMATLVIVGIPIDFIGNVLKMTALKVIKGEILKSFEPEAMYDLAMIPLRNYGGQLVALYWGLWLIPLGLLIYKSGFIPRVLGVLLVVNGAAYIANIFTFILFPQFHPVISKFLMVLFFVGEIPLIFWLMIKGVKDVKPEVISNRATSLS